MKAPKEAKTARSIRSISSSVSSGTSTVTPQRTATSWSRSAGAMVNNEGIGLMSASRDLVRSPASSVLSATVRLILLWSCFAPPDTYH
ncbi:hypothetical protein ACFFX0_22200 [Citricoccus parietis]|uniref:Uncharacterized protein n=1 Tax=Citricoccus parietis TaxID=592307 RepID=A0ABV5G4A9_9MICC